MRDELIGDSTSYELSIAEDGTAKVSQPNRWVTSFGRRHGGVNQLVSLMMYAKMAAFIGVLVLVSVLDHITQNIDGRLAIVFGFLGIIVVFDLIALFLYIHLRRALLIIGALCGCLILASGCFMLLAIGLSHL